MRHHRMSDTRISMARSWLLAAVLVTVCWVSAGDLNPPPGPIAPTNRKCLSQATTPLPFTINQPGSYFLTSSLTGVNGQAGIIVDADDVTLDLNGFSLIGVAGSLDGISPGPTANRNNLTVKNGVIRNWGSSGLRFNEFSMNRSIANMRLEGLTAGNNGQFGLLGGFGSVIRGCNANGNGGDGIFVTNSGGVISHCTATLNGGNGIGAADGATISDCTANNNTGDGINSSNGQVTVVNCTAQFNNGDGIDVATRSLVRSCTSYGNDGDGIRAGETCLISDNNCINNGLGGNAAGVHTTGAGSRVEGNNVVGNDRGIDVDGAGTLVIRNSARGNGTNYDIVGGNTVGPIVNAGNIAASSNPHANYEH